MLSDNQGTHKKNQSPIVKRDLAWASVESDEIISIAHFKIQTVVEITKPVAQPNQQLKPTINHLQKMWLNN